MTRWQRQRTNIDRALADLTNGRIAVLPEGEDAIRVALGDFIGVAGHLDRNIFGLHLEVFSRDQIDDPWFQAIDQSGNATRPYHDERNLDEVTTFLRNQVPAPPHGIGSSDVYRALPPEQKATRFQNVAVKKKSEWALDATDFPDGTWAEAEQLMWWSSVVPTMNAALTNDAAAQLPDNGILWHYHPLGFLAFLNDVTWRSEWPKYRITDENGSAVPAPIRPPRRR